MSELKLHNLQKILALNSKINSSLNLHELLTTIMETAAEVVSSEVASLLLIDEDTQDLVFRVALGDKGGTLSEKFRVKMGEGIAGRVAESGKSLIVKDAQNDARVARRFDEGTGFITKAILCVPLRTKDRVIGVLQALNPQDRDQFTEEDTHLLENFADQAAIAVENAKLHAAIVEEEKTKQELSIAAEIQMNFLPEVAGTFCGMGMCARTVPARGVGGDFYDVLELDENRIGVLIADVAGKGMPAALLMVNAISKFRYLAPSAASPAALLKTLNASLAKDSSRGLFITLLYLILDKKKKTLTHSSAGHHPILQRKANGEVTSLKDLEGMPLGFEAEGNFSEETVSLQEGDAFFLYTDGIVEARSKKGNEFQEDGLKKCIRAGQKTAEDYANVIFKALADFTRDAPQHDDMTALTILVPGDS